MTTKKTLTDEVKQILASLWEFEETTVVPSPENIRLNNNHAKLLKDAVVLYADLKGSTNMVDTFGWQFSAEIYKVYLRVASQLINYEGGVITSYDGDRVMAVFTGKSKNTSAARAALRVNWAVDQILRPAITNQYPKVNFYLPRCKCS